MPRPTSLLPRMPRCRRFRENEQSDKLEWQLQLSRPALFELLHAQMAVEALS